jgi:type I restriction enzyme S subunit
MHTLLLAMYGEGKTRGKVSELLIETTTNQALAALVFGGAAVECRPYVKTFLVNSYEDMRRIAAGGVQPNLNLGLIREMHVPLPPVQEQAEIASEVERLLSVQERLVEQAEWSVRRSSRLRQSILKRAFEGRLVPQDPEDEPASELLARIQLVRAEQAAGGGKIRRKIRQISRQESV